MPSHTSVNLIALGVAAVVAASCNTGLAGPNGAVAAIQVTAAVDSAFALGDTVPFRATATDHAGATLSGVTYTWTSSAPAVATVSKDGIVVAVGNGAATIQAAVNGVSGEAPLTVSQRVAGFAVRLVHDTIGTIGYTTRATATPVDARGHPAPAGGAVTWASSAPGTATVDDSGIVRAIGNGRADILATAGALRDSTTVTVHQKPARLVTSEWLNTYLWAPVGALVTPLTLEVRDSAGHILVADSTTVVRAGITAGPDGLVGRTSIALTGGFATFDSLSVEGVAGDRTLTFVVAGSDIHLDEPLYVPAGAPAKIFAIAGENQSGTGGSELQIPLRVKVTDAYGNPVYGVTVAWNVVSGSGVVTPLANSFGTLWTDDYGEALATYTLGGSPGMEEIHANADSLNGSPVIFSETVTAASVTVLPAPSHR